MEDTATADPTRALAAAWLDDVPELTDRLLAAIFRGGPESADYRPVPPGELRDGCHRYLTRVLHLLTGDQPGSDTDDVAAEIGRHRAAQGVPLEAMLRTFRLGGRVVWEAMLERAVRTPPEAIGPAATAIWAVVDGLSSALAAAYRSAQLEQLRRDEQHRHALIEGVLADRARDDAFAQRVAEQLDLPRGGAYLVVVADVGADGEPTLRGPRTALASVRVGSVWHLRADTLIGLIPLDSHRPGFVLDRLRPLARGRAAAASTAHGLAEVGLAHRLALTTLGTLPSGTVALVPVEDRFPQCLLVGSPELRRRLVASWLDPLLELPAREREMLLHTLTAWLDAGRSAGLAAERLYCHRNTVLNRLHRVQSLLGRDLEGRQAFVELSLALDAIDLPGEIGQSAQ
ncbi:hypothetical protein BKA01_004046 [Pseudonocardia eucalypti]|nr:hypothetical protein [Pseudonocardia eucalypti]